MHEFVNGWCRAVLLIGLASGLCPPVFEPQSLASDGILPTACRSIVLGKPVRVNYSYHRDPIPRKGDGFVAGFFQCDFPEPGYPDRVMRSNVGPASQIFCPVGAGIELNSSTFALDCYRWFRETRPGYFWDLISEDPKFYRELTELEHPETSPIPYRSFTAGNNYDETTQTGWFLHKANMIRCPDEKIMDLGPNGGCTVSTHWLAFNRRDPWGIDDSNQVREQQISLLRQAMGHRCSEVKDENGDVVFPGISSAVCQSHVSIEVNLPSDIAFTTHCVCGGPEREPFVWQWGGRFYFPPAS